MNELLGGDKHNVNPPNRSAWRPPPPAGRPVGPPPLSFGGSSVLIAGRPVGPPPCDRCGRRPEKLYFIASGSLVCGKCDFELRSAGLSLETKGSQ